MLVELSRYLRVTGRSGVGGCPVLVDYFVLMDLLAQVDRSGPVECSVQVDRSGPVDGLV